MASVVNLRNPSTVWGFVAAAVLVAAAAGVHLLIAPLIHPSSPYALFYLAILGCAWYYGVRPGILAAVLSTVVVEGMLAPPGGSILRVLPFVVAAAGMIGIARLARRIRSDEDRVNAHLAAIVHSTDDVIVLKDLDGVIQNCNPACERLFGYSASELVGRPVTMLIPEELQDEEPRILARLRRGERIEHYETVRVAKDGRRLDVSLTISPVRNAAGEIIGVSKIARDVTERKAAQRRLAAQQEWFRVTLDSIGDAVITSDSSGKLTFLNAAASRLTGWDTTSAIGRPLREVFRITTEGTGTPVEDPATAVLRDGHAVAPGDGTVLINRNGSVRPIEHSGAPIRTADGEILGVVLVFRDVSERRSNEEERQAAGADRERLLEAERMARAEAERANRVKDDFVAVVSHELRTPLNAILGWTEVLLQGRPDQQTLRGLEVIRRNTQVQSQLISDLLDISRVVSGKLLLDLQRIDLVRVIESAIETVQHSADARAISIVRHFDVKSAETLGDSARLQQVIWNLLSNAIKFTPPGGRIEIRMRQIGARVEISVTDNGIGIQPEMLDRVFDRFHQQNGPTTRRHGGLGLGLAIVRHLLELHGGSVWAHSDGLEKGATFTVTLPLASADTSKRPAEAPAAGGTPLDAHTLQGVRVLVVEDEADNRDLIRRLLEAHGAEVVTASSAAEAVAAASARRPDILVSDIGLPDVDGYELIRRLRQLDADGLDNIPAVALTAFARSEDRTRALLAGYQAHIAKPVEPAELVATLASFADLLPQKR
jgi:PAS domain S-box-containing protein